MKKFIIGLVFILVSSFTFPLDKYSGTDRSDKRDDNVIIWYRIPMFNICAEMVFYYQRKFNQSEIYYFDCYIYIN